VTKSSRCVLKEKKHGCIAHASKVLGDKWTPLIIRALALKPRRFSELENEIGTISPSVLSQRLEYLRESQIVHRAIFPDVPPRVEYSLTNKGRDLIPVLQQMAAWGAKYA
jgi:DNA-binding HxlR family transcriptional regulator